MLNLTSLTDPLGDSIDFIRIKAILILAAATNTNNIVVGGAASNTFLGWFGGATHTLAIPPGGLFLIGRSDATGWPTTASTAINLELANSGSGSGVTGTLVVIGSAE